MLNRFARSYRNLRYLPRNLYKILGAINSTMTSILAALTEIATRNADMTAAVAGIAGDVTVNATAVTGIASDVTVNATAVAGIASDITDIAAGVADLRRQRRESFSQSSAALADIHTDINVFCNDVTKAILGLQQTVDTTLVHQEQKIETLHHAMSLQMLAFPSWIWAPATSERVRSILSRLSPMQVPGLRKIRLGRDHDGGYVMLDDFADLSAALSLGIADDVSWDRDVAARGLRVLQFDPTVPATTEYNPLFHFEPLLVAPRDAPGAISLETIVRTRVAAPDASLLLKMDIEGSEWDVLEAVDEATFGRFKQIVCEFHNLECISQEAFGARADRVFRKLVAMHFVFHVHGNNCGNFVNVGNVVIPQSLEVSFALRSAYNATPSTEIFPTPLDRPNQPGRADLYLGTFRFDSND